MTEMIERVARAIYEGRNGRGCRAWGSQPQAHQESYLKDARAAIEAMWRPTEQMVEAGMAALRRPDGLYPHDDYRAMILAALNPSQAGPDA